MIIFLFLCLIWKRDFRDKWHMFLYSLGVPVTQLTESEKKLSSELLYILSVARIYLQQLTKSILFTSCCAEQTVDTHYCIAVTATCGLIFSFFHQTGDRWGIAAFSSDTSTHHLCIHMHTHPFNGPFSGTTRVRRYQKGKTNLDFTEARDSEWQLHQLGHTQVCTSLQTDNHASTSPLSFLQAGCTCA